MIVVAGWRRERRRSSELDADDDGVDVGERDGRRDVGREDQGGGLRGDGRGMRLIRNSCTNLIQFLYYVTYISQIYPSQRSLALRHSPRSPKLSFNF